MEKIDNRIKYLKPDNFSKIKSLVCLTPKFLDAIEKHLYFKSYVDCYKGLPENEQKLFILLELTRERSTCQAIINILQDCDQTEAAKELDRYNKSSGPMPITYDEELEVAHCLFPKKDMSSCYDLNKRVRGKCVIYNTMEEPHTPDIVVNGCVRSVLGLKKETNRFKHLFQKLFFDVEVINKMNVKQLRERLNEISQEKRLKEDEAFVMIVLSHGQNEQVFGSDACDLMRRINFGQLDPQNPEVKQEINKDLIDIKEIVEIFSEPKCHDLRMKPKLFYFICCRIERAQPAPQKERVPIESKESGVKEFKGGETSFDTFVAYSCAKGYKTFYDPFHGYTFFGQALSHSLAQYACEEPLSTIMNRTSKRLRVMIDEENRDETQKQLLMGCYAIEVTTYAMSNQLYFNPGIAED